MKYVEGLGVVERGRDQQGEWKAYIEASVDHPVEYAEGGIAHDSVGITRWLRIEEVLPGGYMRADGADTVRAEYLRIFRQPGIEWMPGRCNVPEPTELSYGLYGIGWRIILVIHIVLLYLILSDKSRVDSQAQ